MQGGNFKKKGVSIGAVIGQRGGVWRREASGGPASLALRLHPGSVDCGGRERAAERNCGARRSTSDGGTGKRGGGWRSFARVDQVREHSAAGGGGDGDQYTDGQAICDNDGYY